MSQAHTTGKVLAGTVGAVGLLFATAQAANAATVTVKQNDTVWSLAQEHGVSVKSIETLNKVKALDNNTDLIFVGQKIQVGKSSDSSQSKKGTYTIKAGDTLWDLADKYGTSVHTLQTLNHLDGDTIVSGEALVLPSDAKVAKSTTTKTATSTASKSAVVADDAATNTVTAPSTTSHTQSTSAASSTASTSQASHSTASVSSTSTAKSSVTSSATTAQSNNSSSTATTQTTTAKHARIVVAPKAAATTQSSTTSESTATATSTSTSSAPTSSAAKSSAASTTTPASASSTSQAAQSTSTSAAASTSTKQATPVRRTTRRAAAKPATTTTTTQSSSSAAKVQTQSSATQSSRTAAKPTNTAVKTQSSSAKSAANTANLSSGSVTGLAMKLAGANIPYVYGGSSLSGMDCSGLVAYVYQHAAGISLPHSTVAQEAYVSTHSVKSAKPGDILFWGSRGGTYHDAIYLGNNQYVAAPTEGQNVEVQTISSYFMPSFAGTLK